MSLELNPSLQVTCNSQLGSLNLSVKVLSPTTQKVLRAVVNAFVALSALILIAGGVLTFLAVFPMPAVLAVIALAVGGAALAGIAIEGIAGFKTKTPDMPIQLGLPKQLMTALIQQPSKDIPAIALPPAKATPKSEPVSHKPSDSTDDFALKALAHLRQQVAGDDDEEDDKEPTKPLKPVPTPNIQPVVNSKQILQKPIPPTPARPVLKSPHPLPPTDFLTALQKAVHIPQNYNSPANSTPNVGGPGAPVDVEESEWD